MRNLAKKGKLEEEVKDQLGDTLIIKQLDVCTDESVKNTVQEILDAEEMSCVSSHKIGEF